MWTSKQVEKKGEGGAAVALAVDKDKGSQYTNVDPSLSKTVLPFQMLAKRKPRRTSSRSRTK
ncbi:hypothetical protein EJ110_NYTH07181 [Nymphaea thermarum]|nr:hypothetical protein EJ110_NYTH07181 [Nymphaea thermarum]